MSIYAWLLMGCGSGGGDGLLGGSDPSGNGGSTEPAQLVGELVFEITDRPLNLSVNEAGLVYCSAQAGDQLFVWDPSVPDAEPDLVTDDLDELQAIFFYENDLYFTTTSSGVTGSLSVMGDGLVEEIATQADDGQLMRWPIDLVDDGSGGWIVADQVAALLFWVGSDGSTMAMDSPSGQPLSLARLGDFLYIGGEDGIWRKEWPHGDAEIVDGRAGFGLLVIDGQVLGVNSSDHLFEVGGAVLGLTELARPASMTSSQTTIYIADHVGQGVWAITL